MVYIINDVIYINETSNSVGIGTNPRTGFDFLKNETVLNIPRGTTEERVAINGAFRYNTSLQTYEIYYDSSWYYIPIIPRLLSVSTNVLKNINDTVTIEGTNFQSSSEWNFMGVSNRIYPAKQILYLNSSNIQLTRPDTLPPSDAPFKIQCRQMGTIAYYASVTTGNIPYFNTAGGFIVTLLANTNYFPATSISATDEVGSGMSNIYVSSGGLPDGLNTSFQASGSNGLMIINGYTSNVAGTRILYPFEVTAIDNGNNSISQNYSVMLINKLYKPSPVATDLSSICAYSGNTSYFIISGVIGSNISDNLTYFNKLDDVTTGGSSDNRYSHLIIQATIGDILYFTARCKVSLNGYPNYMSFFIGPTNSITYISNQNAIVTTSYDFIFTYTIPNNMAPGNYAIGFINNYYSPISDICTSAGYTSRALYSLHVY